MRGVRLARIAAQAELVRLRLLTRRQAVRVVLGVVALVFVLACLAALHGAGYLALAQAFAPQKLGPLYAVLILAAVDLVIALVLGVLAARDVPGRVEREALQVRKAAQQQMMEAAAITALIGPILHSLGMRKVYGLALAALTARYLGGARR